MSLAELESHGVFRNMALALIHHALGRTGESDAALRKMIEQFGWTGAYQIAEVYAYRSDPDKAFEWLERAYKQRDPGVVLAATDPMLRPMHSDPRWQPFLQKMGLG